MYEQVFHPRPAWESEGDSDIFCVFEGLNTQELTIYYERIWAKKIEEGKYKVCCIPFFVYDLAMGDIVQTDENGWLTDILERSGRYVFRVDFKTEDQATITAVCAMLQEYNALLEWSIARLLAIDVESKVTAEALSGRLMDLEQAGLLEYETGKMTL